MCLSISNFSRKHVADEDIVVYKHLLLNKNDNTYLTTYMKYEVEIGSICTSQLIASRNGCDREVNVGLHSFADYFNCVGDAEDEMYGLSEEFDMVIVKCVIPKGAEYYQGVFLGNGFASTSLKYISVLEKIDERYRSL